MLHVSWGDPLESQDTGAAQAPAPDAPPAPGGAGRQETAAPRRRRGRTTALIAAAAVLGVVAGTVTGYAVQYHREPTPLPVLSQPDLRTPDPVPAGPGTTARSVNVNRWVKTDGDLRELLLPKPKGAKTESKAAWQDLFSYAQWFEEEDYMFEELAEDDFRRCASVSWSVGGKVYVDIQLIQFREEHELRASSFGEGQQWYLDEDKWAGNDGEPIPGSAEGRTYVFDEPLREAGYEPLYRGRAVAWRGDIVMLIEYANNSGPINEKDLKSLAKRQLERL
ncbi:hypothetical protein IAG43_14375 [Streptomyces genisteinicus]|uniref:Uncharacterized protein n=1 Tax=Streptomyces genisteinicus TaxID=2768068 RepID=A0A7H0HTX9_9ACTN|nr:hypothetical protein IAG43_14375 [Streptomyces genisteinicus]